tara:strand:- start:150 stop:857 length:708 start_codon:yes stop_codon:yes gene_type:complete
MSDQHQSILECKGLCKRFEDAGRIVDVFSDINLTIKAGECVGILGVSGAGKSTFLHLLGGLDTPTSGEVLLAGRSVASMKERAKSQFRNNHLGFIYQFHHLLPEFNALENVCMPLWVKGVSKRSAKQQASELIDRVGLSQRMTHRVAELSGGERQRIAIARALVTKPSCVLADEPTGNLDAETAEQVFNLMLRLNKTLQTSFVIVTHNKQLTTQMDRALLLKDGGLSTYSLGESS